jgi:dipeptidyl aminopeptidase B
MSTAYTALAQEAEEDPLPLQGARPEVYYDEGPFDAPSSEDEDQELLKQAGDGSKSSDIEANTSSRPSNSPLWALITLLVVLLLLATGIGISAGWWYQGITEHTSKRKQPITMDHIFNGTFFAEREYLAWVPEGSQSRLLKSLHGLIILQPETACTASKNTDT